MYAFLIHDSFLLWKALTFYESFKDDIIWELCAPWYLPPKSLRAFCFQIYDIDNWYHAFWYLIKLDTVGYVYWASPKLDCLNLSHIQWYPTKYCSCSKSLINSCWLIECYRFNEQNWKCLTIAWPFITLQRFIEYLLWLWHCSGN